MVYWISWSQWENSTLTVFFECFMSFQISKCWVSVSEKKVAFNHCSVTFLGDLIKRIIDLSNTTEKPKQSMTYWDNYIIHLCRPIMKLYSSKERERENKCDIGKINSFMNKKWNGCGKAFWIVFPVVDNLDKTTEYSIFKTTAPLSLEQSLMIWKAISPTFFSLILLKILGDRCLPFHFSGEETKV